MGHYFRDEIVAQAKALALTGYSTRKAAVELQVLFPGELETFEDKLDKVRLPELVMAAGVYRDKIFKRQEPKHQLNTQNVQINFISQERPKESPGEDTVEGEVIRDKGDSPSS